MRAWTLFAHTIVQARITVLVLDGWTIPYVSNQPFGVCYPQAPSEAEAQCAALAREGVVYGTATEDMDALTFQTPKLLRRMTFSGASQPILEVDYQKLLQVKVESSCGDEPVSFLLDVQEYFQRQDRCMC